MSKGWFGNSRRHSLAARGVKSSTTDRSTQTKIDILESRKSVNIRSSPATPNMVAPIQQKKPNFKSGEFATKKEFKGIYASQIKGKKNGFYSYMWIPTEEEGEDEESTGTEAVSKARLLFSKSYDIDPSEFPVESQKDTNHFFELTALENGNYNLFHKGLKDQTHTEEISLNELPDVVNRWVKPDEKKTGGLF